MWLPLTKLKNYDTIEMHNTSCVHGFVMTELQRIRVDFAIIKRQKKPETNRRSLSRECHWYEIVMIVRYWNENIFDEKLKAMDFDGITAVFKMFNGAKIQTV